MKYEIARETVIEEDGWGYIVVPGIEMDIPDRCPPLKPEGFARGDKVKVTIIVESI